MIEREFTDGTNPMDAELVDAESFACWRWKESRFVWRRSNSAAHRPHITICAEV